MEIKVKKVIVCMLGFVLLMQLWQRYSCVQNVQKSKLPFVGPHEEPGTGSSRETASDSGEEDLKYANIVTGRDLDNLNLNISCNSVQTKTDPSYKICVHDYNKDSWISGSLIKHGLWEGRFHHNFKTLMRQYPNTVLLDVGTNIGPWSLLAAALGHLVVSVEPTEINLNLLRKSVLLNSFHDRMVLVENAVSDKRSKLAGKGHQKQQSITRMQPYQGEGKMIKSVKLSDLRGLFPKATTVFMKMDIEGYEDYAMTGAGGLFDKVFVPYIMMEWGFQISDKKKRPESFIKMMVNYGYAAVSHQMGRYINMKNKALEDDVIWVHKSAKLPEGLHLVK